MRFRRGCLLLVLQGMASACYVYSPAPATPAPGTRILLELNDQGRFGRQHRTVQPGSRGNGGVAF